MNRDKIFIVSIVKNSLQKVHYVEEYHHCLLMKNLVHFNAFRLSTLCHSFSYNRKPINYSTMGKYFYMILNKLKYLFYDKISVTQILIKVVFINKKNRLNQQLIDLFNNIYLLEDFCLWWLSVFRKTIKITSYQSKYNIISLSSLFYFVYRITSDLYLWHILQNKMRRKINIRNTKLSIFRCAH